MTYQITPVGHPRLRCGYRIEDVEDTPRGFKGIRIKGPDWYAILTKQQAARFIGLSDDEFRAQMIALGLEVALGIPVVARLAPNGEEDQT